MRLKIYNANDFNVKLKSTIHSTGKLGFTEATAKFMKLEVGAGVKFASDDEDESMLYLMYCKEFEDGAFKVAKSGNYFYVNAKGLFDLLGLDYKKNNIMFDMAMYRLDQMIAEMKFNHTYDPYTVLTVPRIRAQIKLTDKYDPQFRTKK